MKIMHDIFPKQKTHKHNLKVEINLYDNATKLYEELNEKGIINRIKNIPQLGVIKVNKRLAKTRFDYVILQLYLHKLIKESLQSYLRYTYNNKIKSIEFRSDYQYSYDNETTMGDILQILTIVYNIGHFYNTFTASRAVTMISTENESFYDLVVNASKDKRYQNAAKTILDNKNYQRLHLLNSLLILEHCDTSKKSVSLAIEILYAYINEGTLPEENKLRYAFEIFKKVRSVSFMAYDLPISGTPLTIDLNNEKDILLLLKEYLSEYNDKQSSNDLVRSISKLLDDTVYNENSNAICYYKISRKIVSLLTKEPKYTDLDYFNELFIDEKSILNRTYTHKRDYVQSQILKLTFSKEYRSLSEQLLVDLEKINYARVGYYDRYSGEQTILVSIKKNCNNYCKKKAAYKIIKCAIKYLRKIRYISPNDKRFLLIVKFFLFYLFDENLVIIKPTISENVCVICSRGKKARIKEVQSLLKRSIINPDEKHEVEFLLSQIKNDTVNDTSIIIPASILVYQKNDVVNSLCEFDGMIIHPMREKEQICFLEAKNRHKKHTFGKKCLSKKLDKFSINYQKAQIQIVNSDAYYKLTI